MSQTYFYAHCLSDSNQSEHMYCFLQLGGKAVMETSTLQINTGGEALLCLFCCKHYSTFMLLECGGLVFLSACVRFHVRMCVELYGCLSSPCMCQHYCSSLAHQLYYCVMFQASKPNLLAAICGRNVAGGTYSYSNHGC